MKFAGRKLYTFIFTNLLLPIFFIFLESGDGLDSTCKNIEKFWINQRFEYYLLKLEKNVYKGRIKEKN